MYEVNAAVAATKPLFFNYKPTLQLLWLQHLRLDPCKNNNLSKITATHYSRITSQVWVSYSLLPRSQKGISAKECQSQLLRKPGALHLQVKHSNKYLRNSISLSLKDTP